MLKPSLDLCKALIECPSVTPDDAGCQALIAGRLAKLGFHIEHHHWAGVSNLWARRGTQAPLVVLAGHTDVVPPGDLAQWHSPPFTASERDGLLYGRGSADMKGALAAMVVALESLPTSHPGSVAMLLTSDEEGPAEHGTQRLMQHLHAQGVHIDYCILGEPSSDTRLGDVIRVGRRGSLHGTLIIQGKQGHIAYPHQARNPLHEMLLPLQRLVQHDWQDNNADFPATSLQIWEVKGGIASNVIPAEVQCRFNLRFSNQNSVADIQEQITHILNNTGCHYQLTWSLSGLPYLTPPGRLRDCSLQIIEQHLGYAPRCQTDGGTSDGRFIAPYGTEVVELGLTHHTIHAPNECIRISDLGKLAKIYQDLVQTLLTT